MLNYIFILITYQEYLATNYLKLFNLDKFFSPLPNTKSYLNISKRK